MFSIAIISDFGNFFPLQAQMEGKGSTDEDDSSRDSTDAPKPVSTFKNTFWKDLEEGKVNLFYTDMYSKVKEGGRASRPTCLKDKHQNVKSEESKSSKKRRTPTVKNEARKKERDKRTHCLSSEFVTSSEDEVVNSDYEIVKSDTSTPSNKLTHDYSDSSSENSVRMPVLKIKVSFRLAAIFAFEIIKSDPIFGASLNFSNNLFFFFTILTEIEEQ